MERADEVRPGAGAPHPGDGAAPGAPRPAPGPGANLGGHSRRRAVLEIGAVILTGGVFLVFENILHRKMLFLLPCFVLWTAYILFRLVREPGLAERWGMRKDNLGKASLAVLPVLAALAIGMLGYRLLRGWRPLPAEAAWLFLVYPLWGLIQQFVVQALVAANLEALGVRRLFVVPVAAALFGLAHVPDWALSALCAGAGLVWTALFFRTRNLFPLAVSHGWLGALVYYWVLERNPWAEMFEAAITSSFLAAASP